VYDDDHAHRPADVRNARKQSLWETATHVHVVLTTEEIPHAVIGGVAVCLHGYRRNTVDLDMLIRPNDATTVRAVLESGDGSPSGVSVKWLMAGDKEGPRQPAVFPDPADPTAVTSIEELPVLTLAALIQSKLACGLGNLRRTNKDFADVVELIAIHKLKASFAKKLHESVRPEFKELVRHAQG
jgi:hypothetical protein